MRYRHLPLCVDPASWAVEVWLADGRPAALRRLEVVHSSFPFAVYDHLVHAFGDGDTPELSRYVLFYDALGRLSAYARRDAQPADDWELRDVSQETGPLCANAVAARLLFAGEEQANRTSLFLMELLLRYRAGRDLGEIAAMLAVSLEELQRAPEVFHLGLARSTVTKE